MASIYILHNAFETVKLLIIERKRILVGGMSIDYALKKKGYLLYDDNEIPDYDFFSPEFHKDAYDLAKVLRKEYEIVDVINEIFDLRPAAIIDTLNLKNPIIESMVY